jgi:ribonucleoside-diphosphate reductase alpha subunit
VQYTDANEVAVCNLASISLPAFVENKEYDFNKLAEVTKIVTRNLNKVIDLNFYPVEEARTSNFKHRPIGIGVQGLADVFFKMKMPFESQEAQTLNRDIFETIYYAAVWASTEIAEREGPYESYQGCPASEGRLQPDLWGVTPTDRWDWDALKERVRKFGLRNSLLVAPMPTASTAQILGNTESFEPSTQNLFTRRTLAGEFIQINRHLLTDLIELGLWDDEMKSKLILHNGSVQNLPVPQHIKEVYKTVWEIKQKVMLDMAGARGPYIDQSQSLNVHMIDASTSKLSSMHFYGWSLGLKTGQYYLRTKAAADAIKFTLDAKMTNEVKAPQPQPEEEICHSCSG